MKSVTSASAEEVLFDSKAAPLAYSWSTDGRFLLFFESGVGDLFALPLSGERKTIGLVTTQFADADGSVSPDGRWLAYASTEGSQGGRWDVYLTSFPTPGG